MADTIATDGNDHILGSEHTDRVNAIGGNDVIFAQGGNDVVFGGAGNDTVVGGGGADILDGQGGADWFVFGRADLNTGFVDTILNFAPGDLDRIVLVDMPRATTQIGFVRESEGLVVNVDVGNDGRVDLAIRVAGATTDRLAEAAFVFDPADINVTGQTFPGTAFGSALRFSDSVAIPMSFGSGFVSSPTNFGFVSNPASPTNFGSGFASSDFSPIL